MGFQTMIVSSSQGILRNVKCCTEFVNTENTDRLLLFLYSTKYILIQHEDGPHASINVV